MTMEGIQRALIGKKQAYRKDELYPSKYAGTSILFDEDEDESRSLLPKCSLLDQSLAISVDAPKTPFFDVKITMGDSTRDDDDDETSRQLDEDEEQLRARVIPVSTADTHWLDDPLRITATSPPLSMSMLHGIALCDDEVDMDEPAHTHYIRTPRTPKVEVVYKGESAPLSPITLPDDYGLERGLAYSSVNDDTHPTSLLKMRNDCSTPTMFQSSPLTSEPDDSLIRQSISMSSFIEKPLLLKASSSPTGVMELDFTFSLPPPAAATSPKIGLISRLVDQLFGGCQPLGGIACGDVHVQCSSEESTMEQQHAAAAAAAAEAGKGDFWVMGSTFART